MNEGAPRPRRPGKRLTAVGTPPKSAGRRRGRSDVEANRSLQEAERKYRSLVENIPDVTWTTDRQGRTLFISPNVRDVYGRTAEEICAGGDAWRESIHPDDRPRVEAAFHELFTKKRRYDVEYRIRREDGQWIWLHDRSVSSYEKDGQWYADGVFSDITQRKSLEERLQQNAERLEELVAARTEQLQESEARYRSLYHTVADGIFVMGPEGRIEDVNDSACAQLGYSRAELIGMPMSAVSARTDFCLAEIFDRLRTAGSLSYETTHRRRDGVLAPVELSIALIEYRGRPAILGVARDIAERRQAEASRQFTQFAVDHMADGAFWMTEDARLFYVNEAACRALGYSRDELLRMTIYDIDPAFTDKRWLESWRQLKAKKSIVLQTVHRARDGRIFPVEVRANYVRFGGREYDCAFARDITDRIEAENALRESEERHRRLVENLKGSHFLYRHDTKGVFTYLSASVADVLGFTPDEFMAHYGRFLTDHPVNEAVRRHTELTLHGVSQPPYEVNSWHQDGSTRWLEVQEVPVFDAEGRVIAVEGVAQDITERKRAEEALREKEHLLSESQRIGHIGTWSVDLATDAVTWTPETYRLFGVCPETFVPSVETLLGLLHPADRAAMQEWIRAALAGTPPEALELRAPLPDGSIRVLSGRGELVYADGDRAVRLVGTVQDITEQKQARAALLESEERYRILLEHGFDGIFVHDNSRIVQLNDHLAEMTGYTRAELLGSAANDLFTPASQERIRQYISSGTGGCYEIELRHREGRIVDVESYGAPCRFQGREARIVGIRDITERKQAREAMRRLNEELERQVAQRTEELRHTVDRLRQLTLELSQAEDRERKRIAGILHEDVQQMLAGARFHLNLLSGGSRSAEESREIIEQVRQMLREAMERSRALSHELSPAIYQVELSEILEWLARHMQQKHGLTVCVKIHGHLESPSEALKAFLYKVAQELLFNVVKHAGVHEAEVHARRMGGSICLCVLDRGRGFDPRELEQVTGFGLLSVCERVRLLGGRMKIRSRPGCGSRIVVAVPDPGVAAPVTPIP